MASNTKETEYKRRSRHKRMGQDRKKDQVKNGTTPIFPIHTPEIDAKAPAAQVSPKNRS